MTMQNLLNTMLSRLDAMPEDRRETLIAHMLKRIEADALEDKRQRDAARRCVAMLDKYPFLDSEYVRAIEFYHDGQLKSIDLRVNIDGLCRIEMRPAQGKVWRIVQYWESEDERENWLPYRSAVADFSEMVALMQRIENEVSALEIIE